MRWLVVYFHLSAQIRWRKGYGKIPKSLPPHAVSQPKIILSTAQVVQSGIPCNKLQYFIEFHVGLPSSNIIIIIIKVRSMNASSNTVKRIVVKAHFTVVLKVNSWWCREKSWLIYFIGRYRYVLHCAGPRSNIMHIVLNAQLHVRRSPFRKSVHKQKFILLLEETM